eukprot:TRINITY_DN13611_c0_g1_i4.p1 TRINITY_DN13611_c0_g1~~TRINITY_DN13611_c0_g1_i4.p1  ORF type:complete len:230 (-),score=66.83 TRINITY_DN13611_c0_g1_i4:253-942(-)
MKKLRGQEVDGKALAVELAGKRAPEERGARAAPVSRTLYVSGIAPTVTDSLLRERFSAFGHISNVAITRDRDGNPKGYAFVEFYDHVSAARAREGLHGKDLEGQRLGVFESKPKSDRGAAASPYAARGAAPLPYSPYDYYSRVPVADDRMAAYQMLYPPAYPSPPAAAVQAAPTPAADTMGTAAADPYAAYGYPYAAYDPSYAAAASYSAVRRDTTRASNTRAARFAPY